MLVKDVKRVLWLEGDSGEDAAEKNFLDSVLKEEGFNAELSVLENLYEDAQKLRLIKGMAVDAILLWSHGSRVKEQTRSVLAFVGSVYIPPCVIFVNSMTAAFYQRWMSKYAALGTTFYLIDTERGLPLREASSAGEWEEVHQGD